MEAFYSMGDYALQTLFTKNKHIFLDLKLNDIPNTVYRATKAILIHYPVDMINMHLISGKASVKAFKDAVTEVSNMRRKTIYSIGVTILTSLSEDDMSIIGINNIAETVSNLSTMAFECGLDGVVCSTKEAPNIKQHLGSSFLTVTPGIRFDSQDAADQRRTGTLVEAAKWSDFAVIGRALTQSEDPNLTLEHMKEMLEGLS
jgi:orotidine-5'-phosphate decarboxylase